MFKVVLGLGDLRSEISRYLIDLVTELHLSHRYANRDH